MCGIKKVVKKGKAVQCSVSTFSSKQFGQLKSEVDELLAISHAKSSWNHINFRYPARERDYLFLCRDLQL